MQLTCPLGTFTQFLCSRGWCLIRPDVSCITILQYDVCLPVEQRVCEWSGTMRWRSLVKCGLTASTGLVVSLQLIMLWSQRRPNTINTTAEELSASDIRVAHQPQQPGKMKDAGDARDAAAPGDNAAVDDDEGDNKAEKRTENEGMEQTRPNQVNICCSVIIIIIIIVVVVVVV